MNKRVAIGECVLWPNPQRDWLQVVVHSPDGRRAGASILPKAMQDDRKALAEAINSARMSAYYLKHDS